MPRSKRSSSEVREKREKLIERDGFLCHWCHMLMDYNQYWMYPTLEHIVRVRDGGTWRLENLVLAHRVCNEMRG